MGRGRKSTTAGAGAVSAPGAPARRDAERLTRIPYDAPGGPEATEEEILAWSMTEARLETARKVLGDPGYHDQYAMFPPRRSLEAMLAAWHGVDPEEYKRANAHRPWRELLDEAEGLDDSMHKGLAARAAVLEQHWRARATGRATTAKADHGPKDHWSDELREQYEKAGPGARSGRIGDYSRAELRKALGYLEREAKGLSDDDLRAMALDSHLAPRWNGSTPHAQLAAWAAERYSTPRRQRLEFQKAMRTPYGELERRRGTGSDDDTRSPGQLMREITARHPFLAAYGNDMRLARKVAEANGIPLVKDPSERQRVAADQRFVTPLQRQFGPAFDGFCEEFGGAKRLRHVTKGTKGLSAYGVYSPDTGDVGVSPRLVTLIERARQGRAQPREIAAAVSTVSHELGHATEARDHGNARSNVRSTTTAEHTVGEGMNEAVFGRLHVDRLADRMGLWDSTTQGTLRAHDDSGSYGAEVETMVALTAAACGEFDEGRCRAGAYKEPEALSTSAQRWMTELMTSKGIAARMEAYADALPGGYGGDERKMHVHDGIEPLRDVLRSCKRHDFGFTRVRALVDADDPAKGYTTRYQQPQPFSEVLAERVKGLL